MPTPPLGRLASGLFLLLSASCGRGTDHHIDSAGAAIGGAPLAPPDSLVALGADSTSSAAKRGSSSRPDATPVAASPGELAGLEAVLVMPVQGVDPATLRDTYSDARVGHVHEALDIMAPRGTPVLSATDGRLLRLHNSRAGGNMIYAADATDRFILMYAHLDHYAPGLADGMPLRRGQVIGYVGTTGNAPPGTPHLHFALARGQPSVAWWRGTPVNPYPLLTGKRSPMVATAAPTVPPPVPAAAPEATPDDTPTAPTRSTAAAVAPSAEPRPAGSSTARASVEVSGKRGTRVRLLATSAARLVLRGKSLSKRGDTVVTALPAAFDVRLGASDVQVESTAGAVIDVRATLTGAPARRLSASGSRVLLRRGGAEIAVPK